MSKKSNRIGAIIIFVLCCLIGLHGCDNSDAPDVVAKKYIYEYFSGNWDNFFGYHISKMKFDDIVQLQAKVLEKDGVLDDRYLQETNIDRKNNYENIVRNSYKEYEKDIKKYQIDNIRVIDQELYNKEETKNIVSEVNNKIQNIINNENCGNYNFLEREVFSSLVVDPNDIKFICHITLEIAFTYNNRSDAYETDIYLAEINEQWKIYPYEHQDCEVFFWSAIIRGKPL